MSHPEHKSNSELGARVHAHLLSKGLETPMTDKVLVDSKKKVKQIAGHFEKIMDIMGLDLTDDSLIDTPNRTKSKWFFVRYITTGGCRTCHGNRECINFVLLLKMTTEQKSSLTCW